MKYIVLDLEFNQTYDFSDGLSIDANPKCPFEIIQIGAVVLDENFEKLRQMSFFVKPQLYTRMHPIVHKLTGLSMDILEDEKHFDAVYKDFISFIGQGKNVLCVWGSNDIKALYRNILFYNLNNKLLTRKYINVQQLASVYLKHPSNNSIGLKTAVEALNLEADLSYHDALNDAIYTAKIFRIIKTNDMEIQSFNINQLKQRNLAKTYAINSALLFRFVENDLKRKLTDKEKETVMKVYNAGQNHQYSTGK